MSRRRTRDRKSIDYSKLGQIEGMSDEEIPGLKKDYESDSDGYNEAQAADDQEAEAKEEEEEEVYNGELHDEDDSGAEPEEPDGHDLVDFGDERGGSRKSRSKRSDRQDAVAVDLPPLQRKKKNVKTLSSLTQKPTSRRGEDRRDKRSENLRERFNAFYGYGDEELVTAAYDRYKWGSRPFSVAMDLLTEPPELTEWLKQEIVLPTARSEYRTIEYTDTCLPSVDDQILVQTEKVADISQIRTFETVRNTASQSLVLNCGFPVAGVAWATGHPDTSAQFLAVGTLDTHDRLDSQQQLREISVHRRSSYPSTLQIYRISPQFECKLYMSISHQYGSPQCIKWRPFHDTSSQIGMLAAVFQDGILRVFEVPMHNHETAVHYMLDSPAFEFGLDTKIVTACWRTNEQIAVGTSEGFIGEFDIGDESEDAHLPSYYFPVHDSVITAITCAFPDHPNIIFTTGTDGYGRSYDVRDLRRAKAPSSRIKGYGLSTSYAYHNKSFVSLEDVMTCKLVPMRKLNTVQAGTSLTRHTAYIQSSATSLYHPLVITGAADGTLNVGNMLRRTLVTKRLTNTFYHQCNLWSLDMSDKTGKPVYRFTDNNIATEFGKGTITERLIVHPPQVAIMHLDWCQATKWGGVYAAGTMSGLLRIENMCIE